MRGNFCLSVCLSKVGNGFHQLAIQHRSESFINWKSCKTHRLLLFEQKNLPTANDSYVMCLMRRCRKCYRILMARDETIKKQNKSGKNSQITAQIHWIDFCYTRYMIDNNWCANVRCVCTHVSSNIKGVVKLNISFYGDGRERGRMKADCVKYHHLK